MVSSSNRPSFVTTHEPCFAARFIGAQVNRLLLLDRLATELEATMLHREQNMMRLARLLILASTLLTTGCLYSALGVRHNYTVAEGLRVGMPANECVAVLANGGRVEVDDELPVDSSVDRAEKLRGHWVPSLERAERDTGRQAASALVVTRWWGFMGFGVFVLFLDEHRQLVGYHLDHIN